MMREHQMLVLSELTNALNEVRVSEFDSLVQEIMEPRRILVVGVGRVLVSLKAWVKRLVHLELDINYVGSETEQPLGKKDLLIVASSSGESVFPVSIARIAKEKEAQVFYIGCEPESSAAGLSDYQLILQGRTKFGDSRSFASMQPMSTLFEQQLFLLGDILTLQIMQEKGWDESMIKNRHANLE